MAKKKKHVVLTGTSSGLGKYFHLQYPDSWVVKTKTFEHDIDNISKACTDIDLVVHCAFDSSYRVDDYADYLRTNVIYTERLIDSLKPRKFIYMSSVNVYLSKDTNYKLTKLISENLVRDKTEDNLILRCSAISGPTMRDNSAVRIFKYNNPELRLSAESSFNYILQKDIFDFVEKGAQEDIRGTYDFASSTYINLKEVCDRYDKRAAFGEVVYTTPVVSNEAIKGVFPQANRTSEEVLDITYRRINSV